MAEVGSKFAHWRQDVLEAARELLQPLDDVQPGQMMGHPAFYFAPPGGKRKMFACVFGAGLGLKFSPERCTELLEQPGFTPFVAGGSVMGGWVVFDPGEDASALAEQEELLHEALDWVSRSGRN